MPIEKVKEALDLLLDFAEQFPAYYSSNEIARALDIYKQLFDGNGRAITAERSISQPPTIGWNSENYGLNTVFCTKTIIEICVGITRGVGKSCPTLFWLCGVGAERKTSTFCGVLDVLITFCAVVLDGMNNKLSPHLIPHPQSA